MLDHEARYGPTKCPPLPYERPVTEAQQSRACEGQWSGGEAAELCRAKLWGAALGAQV